MTSFIGFRPSCDLHSFVTSRLISPSARCGVKNGHIQGVSRLVDIIAGGDFLGLCDQKSSYKHVSDFGRLRSYGHFF